MYKVTYQRTGEEMICKDMNDVNRTIRLTVSFMNMKYSGTPDFKRVTKRDFTVEEQ